MSLLDDLRNLLARHLAHVKTQTNQGVAHLIQDHFDRLDAVVSNDMAAAEAKVHEVLGELYAALNAPAVTAAPTSPAPVTPVPPSEPVIVGEAGPELPVRANPTSMAPAAPAIPDPAPAEPLPAETPLA